MRSKITCLTRRPCVRTRPVTKALCRLTPAAAAATAEFVAIEFAVFFLLRRVLELLRADCRGAREGAFRLGLAGREGASDGRSCSVSCSGVANSIGDVILVALGGVSGTKGAGVATMVVPVLGPGPTAAPFSISSAGSESVRLLCPKESWAASLACRVMSASSSSDSSLSSSR